MLRKLAHPILAFLLGTVLALSMLLPAFAAVSVPQPTEEFYIYDEPDVFSKKLEASILEENARLNEAYGVQLVMVAMEALGDDDIKDFTVALMDEWKIGGEDGKGLVLVLDIDGDNYFTLAGAGLRSFLTSDVLQRLLDRNLEESFAMKNYDAGVGSFFEAVTQRIEEEFGVPEESTSEDDPEDSDDPAETESDPETSETQESEQAEPSTEVQTEPAETQPAETQAAAAERSSGGSGFWGVVKVIFWIALILLCLILLLFVILVIRRRRYEKQREARRKAKQRRE